MLVLLRSALQYLLTSPPSAILHVNLVEHQEMSAQAAKITWFYQEAGVLVLPIELYSIANFLWSLT